MKKVLKTFLGNKKLLALAILLVGVFGCWVLISRADDQKAAFESADSISEKKRDSDNDGLANWEEELLGTNPYQADTDGDGFLDGEEVLSKHDPLIAGPDDNLEYVELDKKVREQLKEPNNLTEALTENTASLSLNPNAPTDFTLLTSAIKETSGSDFFTQAVRKQLLLTLFYFLPPQIKESDLNISQDNSAAALDQYLADLHAIFADQPSVKNKTQVSDTQAVLLAVQQRQFKYADDLAAQWSDIYKRSKSIEVPSILLEAHLTGLRGAYVLSRAYAALSEIEADPAKVIIAVQEIQKGDALILDTYNQLALINSTP